VADEGIAAGRTDEADGIGDRGDDQRASVTTEAAIPRKV